MPAHLERRCSDIAVCLQAGDVCVGADLALCMHAIQGAVRYLPKHRTCSERHGMDVDRVLMALVVNAYAF
jgi:hypothetical protein